MSICYSCGTQMPFSYSTYQCNVCRQTEIMSRQMNQQAKDANRRYEMEQSRQAMQRALDEYNQAYAETQAYREPTYNPTHHVTYTPDPPPTPEDIRKAKELKALDFLLIVLLILFPFAALALLLPLLWMITSGWTTFFSFIITFAAVPFVWLRLGQAYNTWTMVNVKYLMHIR